MSILAKKKRKHPKKHQLAENQNITDIKMSAKGGPGFTFNLPGGGLPPVSYATVHQLCSRLRYRHLDKNKIKMKLEMRSMVNHALS